VTPSVFVPNDASTVASEEHKNASDSWAAFPATRCQVLDTIVEHKVQNVVFLSGDIHCSCVARMRFAGSAAARRLKAYAITSSAFYWPFPFADGAPSDYVHDSKKEQDTFQLSNKIVMDYEAFNFTQEDNFCQVDIEWNQPKPSMVVRTIGSDGRLLRKVGLDGQPGDHLMATLDLAP